MDHNGFERQTRHFSATININWTNPAWVGYFSPHLEKIKQLLICSKHQNTWEDTGNIVKVFFSIQSKKKNVRRGKETEFTTPFVTGRNSLHYCSDVSYQCWFASEEAKIYCNNFNSSNAVVCSHLILAYTVRLAIINAVELERNGWVFFFYLYWGMLCCDWKWHRQKACK